MRPAYSFLIGLGIGLLTLALLGKVVTSDDEQVAAAERARSALANLDRAIAVVGRVARERDSLVWLANQRAARRVIIKRDTTLTPIARCTLALAEAEAEITDVRAALQRSDTARTILYRVAIDSVRPVVVAASKPPRRFLGLPGWVEPVIQVQYGVEARPAGARIETRVGGFAVFVGWRVSVPLSKLF